MGEKTAISWCDATWNPWWGCLKVSPGCVNCYAETFSKRVGWDIWGGANTRRRYFGDKHCNEPLKWNRDAEKAGVRRKVFCGSMCDWAEDRRDLDGMRWHLFNLIERTPSLDWLLLTKRPENILGMIPDAWKVNPLLNVWMGTTTENQKYADERIPLLLQVPAAVRFLSVEPMVGPVDLFKVVDPNPAIKGLEHPITFNALSRKGGIAFHDGVGIDWVIVGGESGPKARPMHPEWARSLQRQCQQAGVPFFFKQHGEYIAGRAYEDDTFAGGFRVETDHGKVAITRAKWLDEVYAAVRVGKKDAGDLLDGKQFHEFPR
jgi:protein gp37